MDKNTKQLMMLYEESSKHSNYQILHPSLQKTIGLDESLQIKSRYEQERFDYILSKVNFKNKVCCDIGGNTGYFSFASLEQNAKLIHYYEGNQTHAKFVKLASQVLQSNHKLRVISEYINLESQGLAEKIDILFLLNVLHHVGDDYGEPNSNALEHVIYTLNTLAAQADTLIFQLGFNWKGNRNLPIFKNGTKNEMINFIREYTKAYWNIKHIGIAEKQFDNTIKYNDLNQQNTQRNDELGEFLNRPIFIMKSQNLLSK